MLRPLVFEKNVDPLSKLIDKESIFDANDQNQKYGEIY